MAALAAYDIQLIWLPSDITLEKIGQTKTFKMQESKINTDRIVEDITASHLYEGYSLYPYKNSTPANRTPIPFGRVYPIAWSYKNKNAKSKIQTACLVQGNEYTEISVDVKFLQMLAIDEEWIAIERQIKQQGLQIINILQENTGFGFGFSSENAKGLPAIEGYLKLELTKVCDERSIYELTISVTNTTYVDHRISDSDILPYIFISTHTILKTNKISICECVLQ